MSVSINLPDGLSSLFLRCGGDGGFLRYGSVTLHDWIDTLVAERYKTTRALATAIGMTESGFSRAVKAGTFEVENCLRLALETGAPAADVFTMAGKGHVNALIERLYGPGRPAADPAAAKAADIMMQIRDAQAREGFLLMLRGYLTAQQRAEATPAIRAPRRR